MNIILKKEWSGYPVGRELTVSDNRGSYLKEIGIAEPDKKKAKSEVKPQKKEKKNKEV